MCPPAFNINTLSQRFEPRQLNQQRREEKQINTAKKNAEFGHFRPATANPPIHQSTGKWVSFARAFRANQREIRSRSYATRLDGGGARPFVQCNFHVSEEFYPFFLSPTYLFPFIWFIESSAFGIFHCRHESQAFN